MGVKKRKLPQHFKKSNGQPKADPNYETPQFLFDFLDKRFEFQHDLAAVKENAKKPFFSDSMKEKWSDLRGYSFLNPPFAGIRAWIEKASEERTAGAKIVLLAPVTVLGAPYMRECSPERIIFYAGCPAFRNTFNHDKVIRFMPMLMVFDRELSSRRFEFISKKQIQGG